MEKKQLELFPCSTQSSDSSQVIDDFDVAHHHHHSSNKVRVKREDVLRSQKKEKSNKKCGNKKQHKYVFETRSQIDILDDGYRWRKYGEKRVKNNKFSRSYYRCCYQGCNVKKQIQRHSKDEQIVVTTYFGMHMHPIEKSTESFEQILRNLNIYNQLYNLQP